MKMERFERTLKDKRSESWVTIYYLCDLGDQAPLKLGFLICRANALILRDCNKNLMNWLTGLAFKGVSHPED